VSDDFAHIQRFSWSLLSQGKTQSSQLMVCADYHTLVNVLVLLTSPNVALARVASVPFEKETRQILP
jgi:hypothetical protein